jgi:hypothetical protein
MAFADFRLPAVYDSLPVEYRLDSNPRPVYCMLDPISTLLLPNLAKDALAEPIDID